MKRYNSILLPFFTGMGISAIGSLPLGNLNVMAMSIAVHRHTMAAMYFAVGVLLVEMIYVGITLMLTQKILASPNGLKYFQWMGALLLVCMGLYFGYLYFRQDVHINQPVILPDPSHEFFAGLFLSAINPVQIPFWLGWNAFGMKKQWLDQSFLIKLLWVLGIGIGTFIGLLVFIFLGSKLLLYFHADGYLNLILAAVFLWAGIWQYLKR